MQTSHSSKLNALSYNPIRQKTQHPETDHSQSLYVLPMTMHIIIK